MIIFFNLLINFIRFKLTNQLFLLMPELHLVTFLVAIDHFSSDRNSMQSESISIYETIMASIGVQTIGSLNIRCITKMEF